MKLFRNRAIILLSLIFFALPSHGQDIDAIRKEVAGDPELYASVLELFQRDCKKINKSYLPYVYYGFAFTPQYKGNMDFFEDMYSAIEAGDKEKALEEALKCESQNPVCLELLYYLSNLTFKTPLGDNYMRRFGLMLMTVLSSGDGKTPQTAIKVIRTGDEYKVLNLRYGMEYLKLQTALKGNIDQMDIVTKDGRDLTVYFDRNLPTVRDSILLEKLLNK